jgi:hypothetical protein
MEMEAFFLGQKRGDMAVWQKLRYSQGGLHRFILGVEMAKRILALRPMRGEAMRGNEERQKPDPFANRMAQHRVVAWPG